MADEEVIRQNLNHIAAEEKERFVGALKASRDFSFKSYLPVSENCHFERYVFLCGKEKLGIVYDTKAQIMSFTAKADVLRIVPALAGGAELSVTKASPSQKETPEPKSGATEKAKNKIAKKSVAKKDGRKSKTATVADKASVDNADAAKPAVVPAKPVVASPEPPEYKNGFAVKKCSPQRLDAVLKRVRAMKGVSVTSDNGADIVTYAIADKSTKQKCLLRYTVKKQSVQLQGKRSNLFGEVQVILSRDSGFNEAMGSHMELTDSQMRMSAVQRSLKKLLPDAFDFLGEQSKIDLGIGMIDIGNEEVRLSDYSVLLVPPYRGLERFIFDLQQAREITVKMIGQAYEKNDDGKHVLKLCYRKKNGIVYSEVMSALYTEYFEKRNFYAHSDNSDFGVSRVIPDKKAAEKIFDGLCEIINYNCKKLKEIGFKPLKD